MKKKILIVEDDKEIAEAMEVILTGEGYEVRRASEGQEAISEIRGYEPQLVLLDMLMAGADGREVCRLIKEDAELEKISVVLVSAYPETEQMAKECGADDYLAKPFEVPALLRIASLYSH